MKSGKWTRACAVGLLLALSACGYNTIQSSDEAVKAAWAEVQNQYQRRMDLIPNLVNTVKGAANFEKETLEAVIQARASATSVKMDPSVLDDPNAFKKLQEAQGQLTTALGKLLVVSERYPELTATAGYRDLQAQLEGTENRIAVARKRYVDSVADYNRLVRQFPTNLTARYLLHAEVRPTFEASAGADKPPEVKF
ncbi:MAG TPA: LemA family protein [Myxococcota bacterium]|nr:LemA family protein [Myxococcota bacterium]